MWKRIYILLPLLNQPRVWVNFDEVAVNQRQKDLQYLGRMYIVQNREEALQLLSQRPDPSAFNNIQHYYKRFYGNKAGERGYAIPGRPKVIQQVNLNLEAEIIYNRRVFIACMLHLCLPDSFSCRTSNFRPATGFSKNIQECFRIEGGNLSREIDRVRNWYKVDDDFKDKVDEALAKLREGEDNE